MKNYKRLVLGLVILFSAIAFVPAMAFPFQEKIQWQHYAMLYQQPIVFYVNSPIDDFDDSPGDGFCATIDGLCTLRAAIQEAQAIEKINADVTVEVPVGVYTLTRRTDPTNPFHIVISRYNAYHVVIHGQGPEKTIIQSDGTSGIFLVHYSAIFSGLTIQNGKVSNNVDAGGIKIDYYSEAIIVNCVLKNNQGALGGAVGANLYSYLTIIDSTITDNSATGGGGIFNQGGDLLVLRSTVSHNTATYGGGFYSFGGISQSKVEETTISGNSASFGGGITNWSEGYFYIYSSTITENTADQSGGGIEVNGNPGSKGSVRLYDLILAGNHQSGSPDCYVANGDIFSYHNNLIGSTLGCNLTPGAGDKI